MARTLEQQLSQAGYSLLGTDKIEQLIISILDTKNTRFLKSIPYLIYLYKPNVDAILKKTKQKRIGIEIISITRKIFEKEKIYRQFPSLPQIKISSNYTEFEEEFNLQIRRSAPPKTTLDQEKIYAQRNQEFQLSTIFTAKEKELIKKLLDEKPFTKTEYEYYSRQTKKKLQAILQLQDFSKTILSLAPKRN